VSASVIIAATVLLIGILVFYRKYIMSRVNAWADKMINEAKEEVCEREVSDTIWAILRVIVMLLIPILAIIWAVLVVAGGLRGLISYIRK